MECTCSTIANYATHTGMADKMVGAGLAVEMLFCVKHDSLRISQAAIGAYRLFNFQLKHWLKRDYKFLFNIRVIVLYTEYS